MSDRIDITVEIDGTPTSAAVRPDQSLLTLLRDELGMSSVRTACGIGVCGVCTVRVDGDVVSSCLLPAFAVDGAQVRTPEGSGAAGPGGCSEVQQAFVDAQAFQCSYCIPAMALTVEACLDEQPTATVDDVRAYLGGNLCRCGSYPQILEAVVRLVEARRGDRDDTGATR